MTNDQLPAAELQRIAIEVIHNRRGGLLVSKDDIRMSCAKIT